MDLPHWFPNAGFHVGEKDDVYVLIREMADDAADASVDALLLVADDVTGLVQVE